jgi:hypothetical protein
MVQEAAAAAVARNLRRDIRGLAGVETFVGAFMGEALFAVKGFAGATSPASVPSAIN